LDTNDYSEGGSGDKSGGSYPYSVNPSETIKEFAFNIVGAEIEATITTVSGTTFTIPITSATVVDRWDIDSVELQDPNGNAARVAWWWAGE
jgi:hypothetical protein